MSLNWRDLLQKEPELPPAPEPVTINGIDVREVGNTIRMVGVLYADADQTYTCLLPGEEAELLDNQRAVEMDRDQWSVFMRQTDVMEVEVIGKAADGKLAKILLRKSHRQISPHMQWAVYKRDNYCCRYCGKDGVPLTVDHLVLWEHGGPTTVENLVAACRKCNKTRGNTPYDKWLEHSYYRKVSKGLTQEVRDLNKAVLATLDDIPLMIHKPKHR